MSNLKSIMEAYSSMYEANDESCPKCGEDGQCKCPDAAISEDGHDDVKSAKNQVQIAMSALQKMSMELGKLNDEDALPTWWTNKVAIAVDKLDGMADYLDTQVEETLAEEEIKVGNYQTKNFSMCPGATSLYKKLEPSADVVKSAKLQDELFTLEKKVLDAESSTQADVDKAQSIANQVMALAKKMDMEKEHGYIQGHVDKIKEVMSEENQMDEGMKYTHAAVDKKGLVIGFASDERDAKDMARRNDGKVVKLKKPMSDKKGDMMINRPLKEGTWALPDSPKAKAELKKLMSKPIKLGKEGDDATDKLMDLIGDDELMDDLESAGKKNPNGDARDIVKKHMKRLGIKEEVEIDESSDIEGEISQLQKMLKGLERGKKTPGKGFAKMKIKELIADLEKRQAQEEVEEAVSAGMNLNLVKFQAKDALGKIRHKVAKKGNKFIISVDSNDEEDAQKAMKNHPLYVAGKLRVIPEVRSKVLERLLFPKNRSIDGSTDVDSESTISEKRAVDPADIDIDATDDDRAAASKNIIMQLRKSVDLRGNNVVVFDSGEKKKVNVNLARQAVVKHAGLRKPDDKEEFQKKIAKSYRDLLIALKEK